jgi:RNA polymerase sigma factor (TIGR02999 family)
VTLQPTALVHEAYVRLVDQSQADWRGRTHFVAVASKVMRNLLIDHARARAADKRGGGWQPVTLADEAVGAKELDPDQVLALDQALERLADHDERQARVVELRFFGGLKVGEVAEVLGVSKRTAEGLWTHARAWLLRELSRRDGA